MKAVQEVSPVPVRFDEISSGAKGYYSNTEKEIVIQNGMSESQTMKTGIHEVTHAMLHDREFYGRTGREKEPDDKGSRSGKCCLYSLPVFWFGYFGLFIFLTLPDGAAAWI